MVRSRWILWVLLILLLLTPLFELGGAAHHAGRGVLRNAPWIVGPISLSPALVLLGSVPLAERLARLPLRADAFFVPPRP